MAEVIEDKIIIQGLCISESSSSTKTTWKFTRANVPFSTFVDIPGAVPGMDVRIKPQNRNDPL